METDQAAVALEHPMVKGLLQAVSDGVLAIDAQSRKVLAMNPVAKKLLGYENSDVVGCQCKNLMKSPACTWSCPLSAILKGKSESSTLDLYYRGAHEQRLVHATTRMLLIQSPEGRPLIGLELFKDLSDVHDLQKALKKRRGLGSMIGRSEAMQELYDLIEQIAPYDIPVLITGESGVGKERCADALHQQSRRAQGPLIKINCAALSPNLVESELFGHKRGAFTGAAHDRRGCFEQAHKGSLMLDEVGELSMAVQAKLLRVLQEGEIQRLGEEKVKEVDVRVIAATNQNLEALVQERTFRQDLYYRLLGAHVHMPPLKERPEDVALLAEHFLALFQKETGGEHLPTAISTDAIHFLESQPWPGNVRELQNRLRLAAIRAVGTTQIAVKHLRTPSLNTPPSNPSLSLAEVERETIHRAVKQCDGNLTEAAKLLEIDRTTLWRKLKKYERP